MKKESHESIGKALVRTVAGELVGLGEDVVEVALDSVLTQGVLQELPVVGSFVRLTKAGAAIREELFLRKLLLFLKRLEEIPLAERQEFLRKHASDSSKQRDLGDNLVLALERLDDLRKAEILARIFASYVVEDIDSVMFWRLRDALERFNLELLPHLRWCYVRDGEQVHMNEEIQHELSLAGLLTARLAGSGTIGGSAFYGVNDLGREFLRVGFGIV